MRALSWFVVVCLVAVSGAGRAAAHAWLRAPAIAQVAPSTARAAALRGVRQAPPGRTRVAEEPLPPATLVARWSAPVRAPVALALFSRPFERVDIAVVRTGSARGPPLA